MKVNQLRNHFRFIAVVLLCGLSACSDKEAPGGYYYYWEGTYVENQVNVSWDGNVVAGVSAVVAKENEKMKVSLIDFPQKGASLVFTTGLPDEKNNTFSGEVKLTDENRLKYSGCIRGYYGVEERDFKVDFVSIE